MDERKTYLLPRNTVLRGRYRIEKVLGEGGFGITYRGYDLDLQRYVAIKEYYPYGYAMRDTGVSADVYAKPDEKSQRIFEAHKELFLEEARNQSKCEEIGSVVDVVEYFKENCTAYIVMKFLDGVTLKECLRDGGAMNAEWLSRLMLPLIRDVDRIHQLSFLHRDISPDNIMLMTDNGKHHLKLMDFGAARQYDGDEQRNMTVLLKHGFAPYEQYTRRGNQGPWTDVYGLSATLYACVTNSVPDTATDRMQQDELKKPSQLGIVIHADIEKVIIKGLSIHSHERYQSAKDMADALEAALKKVALHADEDKGSGKTVLDGRTELSDGPENNDSGENKGTPQGPTVFDPPPLPPKPPVPPDPPKPPSGEGKNWIIVAVVFLIVVSMIVVSMIAGAWYINRDREQMGESDKLGVQSLDEANDLEKKEDAVLPAEKEPDKDIVPITATVAPVAEFTAAPVIAATDTPMPMPTAAPMVMPSPIQSLAPVAIPSFVPMEDSGISRYDIISENMEDVIKQYGARGFVYNDFENYRYEEQENGTIKITSYRGNSPKIIIPDEIDGKKVTKIGQNAFSELQTLNCVIIPPGVTSIEYYAFYACENLISVLISGTVKYVRAFAFAECKNLREVFMMDGVRKIEKQVFSRCTSLTTVAIPDSVDRIDETAFYDASKAVIYCSQGSYASIFAQALEMSYALQSAGENKGMLDDPGQYKYTEKGDGTLLVWGYEGDIKFLRIPDEIDGKMVSEVRTEGFSDLEGLVIPPGIVCY